MSPRPLPQFFTEVSNDAANAAAARRTREREASRVGLAQLVFALLVGALLAQTAAGASLWTHRPASDIRLYRVTDAGTLLVGSKAALYALDVLSGQNIWETEKMKGAAVAVEPVYEKDLVPLVTVENNSANKARPRVTALRMTTGELAWESEYPDGADLYGIERGGRDEPVALHRRENGTVVVAGRQHLLSFDPRARQIVWSVKYAAPGVPGWQKIAMAGLTALAYTSATATAANSYAGTSENRRADRQRVGSLVAYEQFVSKRYSATKQTGNYVYVLTTVRDGKEEGAGLVGVHTETGMGDRQILTKDKEPDYQVDEPAGRVFNLRNSKELSAFAVDAAPPAEEKKN